MKNSEAISRYERACAFLPPRLKRIGLAVPDHIKERAEEIRLRVGFPMTVLLPEGEHSACEFAREGIVLGEDLEQMIASATEYSRYASIETLKRGYLSLKGGFRLGICGTVVMRDGESCNIREVSSAALRIVREYIGIAEELVPQLFENGQFCSTLILSAPGFGKTTLLRDAIRCLSIGDEKRDAKRITVIDERGEIAAAYQGQAQTELGNHTDILTSCPKAVGIPMALRAMNSQIIAVDEITEEADIHAMIAAANCGVGLLATMHALSMAELLKKPLWRELSDAQVFTKMVTIQCVDGEREYEVKSLSCCALPEAF